MSKLSCLNELIKRNDSFVSSLLKRWLVRSGYSLGVLGGWDHECGSLWYRVF